MKLVELNKEKLNSFLVEQSYGQFLQSYEWGEFQERVGQKIFRFAVEKEGAVIAVVFFIKKSIGAGKSYFYCPRGPVLQLQIINYKLRIEVLNFIFDELDKLAKKEGCLFLRFDSIDSFQTSDVSLPIKQTIDVQPSKSLILNLTKPENDLLKEMHQKTRYNIRLAEKKGVIIYEASLDEFDKFWILMSETVDRDGFRLHGKDYYKKMLQNSKFSKLYFAKYQEKIIAANIATFFGDTVTYVHGSSSDNDRNVMAPYLLQWEMIKQAKNLGYKYYDFYGIDEKKWPGVTRFKKGFGGNEVQYSGTFDVVFSSGLYRIYQILRRLRRWI